MRTQRDKERAEKFREQRIIEQEEAKIEQEGLSSSVAASIAALEGAAGRRPFKPNFGLNEESFISGLQVPEAPEVSLGSSMKIGGPLYQDPTKGEIDKPTSFKRTMSGFKPVREKPPTTIDQIKISKLGPNLNTGYENLETTDDQAGRNDLQKKLFMSDNQDAIREQMMKEGVANQGLYSTEDKKIKTDKDGNEIKFVGIAPVQQFTGGVGTETETAFKAYVPMAEKEIYEQRQEIKILEEQVAEENAAGIMSKVVTNEDGTSKIVYPPTLRGLQSRPGERRTGPLASESGGLPDGQGGSLSQIINARAVDTSMTANRQRTNVIAKEALDLANTYGVNLDVDITPSQRVGVLNALNDMRSINESTSRQGRSDLNRIFGNAIAEKTRIEDQTEQFTAQTGLTSARVEALGASFTQQILDGTFDAANNPEFNNFIRSQEFAQTLERALDTAKDVDEAVKLGNAYITGALKVIKQNDERLDQLSIEKDPELIEELQQQNEYLYRTISEQLFNYSSTSKVKGSKQAMEDLFNNFNIQVENITPEITKTPIENKDDNDEKVVDEAEDQFVKKYPIVDTFNMGGNKLKTTQNRNATHQEILKQIELMDKEATLKNINDANLKRREKDRVLNLYKDGDFVTLLKEGYIINKET